MELIGDKRIILKWRVDNVVQLALLRRSTYHNHAQIDPVFRSYLPLDRC
jgi:hypothetical protein